MKTKTASVKMNVWGNLVCRLGNETLEKYASEFDAKVWLAKQIVAGHKVSSKSLYSASDVEVYKGYITEERVYPEVIRL